MRKRETDDEDGVAIETRPGCFMWGLRREIIIYIFSELLHAPPEAMWNGPGGTVAKIFDVLKPLHMQGGADRRAIRRTVQRHVAGEQLANQGGGRTQKLTEGEAFVVADCFARGLSEEQAAFQVSAWRRAKGTYDAADADVSRTAVNTAFAELGGITRARGTRPQGSHDKSSAWAKAWLAFAKQLKSQLQPDSLAQTRVRRKGESKKAPAILGRCSRAHRTKLPLPPLSGGPPRPRPDRVDRRESPADRGGQHFLEKVPKQL